MTHTSPRLRRVKRYLLVSFFFSSLICSPIDQIKNYLVGRYCFKSDSSHTTSWLCAYYFAFKKDLFKRETVFHPVAQYQVQQELWRDWHVVKQMAPFVDQLDSMQKKYEQEWPQSIDCFDELNEKSFSERSSYLPCVRLVNKFREEIKKQRREYERTP